MGSAPTTLTGSTPVGGNGTYTTYGRVVQRVQLLDLRRQLAQIIRLTIVRNFINPTWYRRITTSGFVLILPPQLQSQL
jgi:hypothetical protein